MNKRLCLIWVCLFVMALTLTLWADEGRESKGWQRIQQDLNLSAAQMQKVRPIMDAYRKERHAQFAALTARIRGMLNPQQQALFDELKARHHRSDGAEGHHHAMQEFISQLKLSADQARQLKDLAMDCLKRSRAAHAQMLTQIRTVLSAEQFAHFQELTGHHHHHGPQEDALR